VPFRCLLAVGLLVTGAAACSDDDNDGAVPVPSTTERPTTTEAPTTSTTLDFETEVKLAALELLEIRNEVFQNPDVDRVSEYIAETCVCLERERQIVADLAAAGRRWTGPAIVPLGITWSNEDRRGPTLTVAATQPAGEIVGGASPEPVPDVPQAPYRVTLVRNEAGQWRINGLTGITLTSEVFAAIREEGTP
jgi:hypothetical protein